MQRVHGFAESREVGSNLLVGESQVAEGMTDGKDVADEGSRVAGRAAQDGQQKTPTSRRTIRGANGARETGV